jgi:hypothetical protein
MISKGRKIRIKSVSREQILCVYEEICATNRKNTREKNDEMTIFNT